MPPVPYMRLARWVASLGLDIYRIETRFTDRDRRKFEALIEKPIRELTDADRRAWLKLGNKYYGGDMNLYQELKWRWGLYKRRGIERM